MQEYVSGLNTQKSWQLYERARRVLPGGSSSHSHAFPTMEPYPLSWSRGKGSHVWDVDGNEYIDYNLAMGPLVLGHAHPKLAAAVKKALDDGSMFAMPCELEVKAAEMVKKMVPNADMVRFSNSGAEATMYALRFARAHTGKDKIVKFEGCYHGAYDYVVLNTVGIGGYLGSEIAPYPLPGTPGIPRAILDTMIIAPWNNLKILKKIIKRHGNEIAGVITEPVLFNVGTIPPEEGFLKGVQKLCAENDIVFILDEVMTGFRMAPGGAQEYYGLKPDLACFSKALGAGYPVSCVTGKREIMEKVVPGGIAHFGTYNGNPMCMAAVIATLTELSANGGAAYSHMRKVGRQLVEGLQRAIEKTKTEAIVQSVPTMCQLYFTKLKKIKDYRDYFSCDMNKFPRFHREMIKRGTWIHPRQFLHWFVSTAHTEQDIERTTSAAVQALEAM